MPFFLTLASVYLGGFFYFREEKMELQVLESREILGNQFKVYGTIEDPMFLAKDVAEWIEHNKPSELLSVVDQDEKLKALVSHSGQRREMWFLTKDGLYEVLMLSRKPIAREFKKKVKVILNEIQRTGQYKQTSDNLSKELLLVESASKILKVNEASKLLMLQKASKRNGINPIGLLPEYTDEPLTISLTSLLKKYNVKLSAIKANKILIEKGVLEVKERPSRKRSIKQFKSFTDYGLNYGKNLLSPQNQLETQCHFYDSADILKYFK